MMTMIQGLEKFLVTEIAADLGRKTLAPDEDLLDQRIIDSLGILRLVTFIEEAHGIQIGDRDIVPENFQSLNSIVKFIEQKMQGKTSA
jgi:acyl carrier protein